VLESAAEDGTKLISSLNLVDLAGSESVKHTGAEGQKAKEGGKINQSLLSLSRVISALAENKQHVGFRDSKLTRLLQPSLAGNAKMSIICCITPADRYLDETRSTLQFASRAKLVKTNAKVNEVVDDAVMIKRYIKELEDVKEKLRVLEAAASAAMNGGQQEELMRIVEEKNEYLKVIEEKNSEIANKDVSLFLFSENRNQI
jgi:centromeric protein E